MIELPYLILYAELLYERLIPPEVIRQDQTFKGTIHNCAEIESIYIVWMRCYILELNEEILYFMKGSLHGQMMYSCIGGV